MQRFATEANGDPALAGDPTVWAAYATYSWPGNVRELRNLVERLVVHRRMGLPSPSESAGQSTSSLTAPSGLGDYRTERTERIVAALRMGSRLRLVELVALVRCAPNTVKCDLQRLEVAGSVRREVGPGGSRTHAWIWTGDREPAAH